MKNIEIIKWGCGFADGFEWVDPYHNNVVTMNDPTILDPNGNLWVSVEGFSKDVVIYPLFLQRVIEGINISETNVNFDISYCDNEYKVEVYDLDSELKEYKIFCAVDCGGIDQAKEQAIKFILSKL